MDNKFIRFCIVEPKCRIRILMLLILSAVMATQVWYSRVQADQLSALMEQEALVERIAVMEKELKTKAQLEAFRNEDDENLENVRFSKISGIAMQEGKPSVLIDQTVYNEGDSFGEYVIVKITEQMITLVNKKTNAIKNLYVFE